MPVYSQHPNYSIALEKWKLVRAIVDNNAKDYIKTVDLNDKIRSQQYKDYAILTNFTALTKSGLTGLVFRRSPESTIPPQLDSLNVDATGTNLSLNQLTQQLVGDLLETGRYGLLVDYPKAPSNMSLQEVEDGNYNVRILPYNAESIINWQYEYVDNKSKLCMVVLQEDRLMLSQDGFEWSKQHQYRILQLIDGVYTQLVCDKEATIIEPYSTPLDANGNPFNYIPFVFIGSENNDSYVDNAPLYDLAALNLGHYRNSADYEESIFVTGQPTVVMNVGDMDPLQWKEINGGGFKFGSRAGHVVGLGGNAQLLQANPNQLAAEAMKLKEIQAAAIGARLIAPAGGGRETAEAARIRYSSQNSALYTLTKNVNAGVEQALKYCCAFVKDANPDLISYELNDKFYEDGADVNLIAQAMQMFDRNIVTTQEIRDYVDGSQCGLIDNSISKDALQLEGDLKSPLA